MLQRLISIKEILNDSSLSIRLTYISMFARKDVFSSNISHLYLCKQVYTLFTITIISSQLLIVTLNSMLRIYQ